MDNNLVKQDDEINSLSAIYGDEFQIEDKENRAYSIKIVSDNICVKLYFKFPDSYPSLSPPTFEISAPYVKKDDKQHLCNLLEEVYLSCVGQSVIFQWTEKIREELQSFCFENYGKLKTFKNAESQNNDEENNYTCPEIIHGSIIADRKSSFQGHVATIISVHQVKLVINKLKENRKINNAKHNIFAYRIYDDSNKSLITECDDDGENLAGHRLLHLLEMMDVKNVIVIVSRWYGGIQLGADRFKHYNNAARYALSKANLAPAYEKQSRDHKGSRTEE